MNLQQTIVACEAYLAADIPNFIWGSPGIGKSDGVKAVAKRPQTWAKAFAEQALMQCPKELPVIDLRAILLDPVDLRGLPAVENGRAIWAQPDFLPRADRDGPVGILFLDELNAAAPSVQAACFQLVLNRRLGDYVMPEGWRIVAAGNRQGDKAAAQRMPSALANRFAHITAEADVSAWSQWAIGANINPLVLAFIRFRPSLLHVMPGQKPTDANLPAIPSDSAAFPTPRAWAQVSKIADAPETIRQSLVSGLVSEGPAMEFEGFCRTFSKLPRIADIIANPDGIQIPNDPGLQYALASALARKADRATIDPIFRFAGRAMGPEFATMLMLDAVQVTPAIKSTGAFVNWAQRNQEVAL